MLAKINDWIDATLDSYTNERIGCACLAADFDGYYTPEFLAASYYVVVPQLPKPDFPELRQMGFGDLIDADFNGITYKTTYFVKQGKERNRNLHFHELVHVLQWQTLGAEAFIMRYMDEILRYGYTDAPLEKMAYALENHFVNGGPPFDIHAHVRQKII